MITTPDWMGDMPLKDALPRAVYVADGGELPSMERHFLIWQEKYRTMAAAVLRTLAIAAHATGSDEGWANAIELEEIAAEVEASRG